MKCTLKIWKRIIERRLSDAAFGFMPGRGMADGTSAVRQRMEKQGKTGIMVFIDLVKAYDRVHRQEVWMRNREKTLPDNYVMIVQNMYERARTLVKPMYGTWVVKKSQNVAEMNEGVKMDERSYQAGQNKEGKN